MTDPLSITSFCLACINLFLSTSPTVVKSGQSAIERTQHIRGYRRRLNLCQTRFVALQEAWEHLKHGEKDLEDLEMALSDMQDLHLEIDKTINSQLNNHEASSAIWQKCKSGWARHVFRRPQIDEPSFLSAVTYVLWQRDILEGWISRLEKALDVDAMLVETEFNRRTAHQFQPSFAQKVELQKLEDYMKKLWTLFESLHEECTKAPNTYAWALSLEMPEESSDLLNWAVTPPIEVGLRYSIDRGQYPNEHFNLRVGYLHDNAETHKPCGYVAKLTQWKPTNPEMRHILFPSVVRSLQDPLTRNTRPLGNLLQDNPDLFLSSSWLVARGDIVRGIGNWAILLWPTSWLKNLCCYGLMIETGGNANQGPRPFFDSQEHNGCNHDSNLRNLGIVLAQIILGVPIRPGPDPGNVTKFEERVGGQWKEIHRSQIVKKVFDRTFSRPLQEAIDFCIGSQAPWANHKFEPGFLYSCIDRIYEPIVEWYKIDMPKRREFHRDRAKHAPSVQQQDEWPEGAMRDRPRAATSPGTSQTKMNRLVPVHTRSRKLSSSEENGDISSAVLNSYRVV